MIFLFIYYSALSVVSLVFNKNLALLLKKRLGVIFLSFLLFVPFLFIESGIRDIELFESVGYHAANKLDIYYYDSDHQLYPYFPLTALVLGTVKIIADFIRVEFLPLWRLVTLVSLLALTLLIKNILVLNKKRGESEKQLLFIFSPIAIFPVLFHAHHDVILLLFYFVAAWLLIFKPRPFLGGLSFGISILAKTWSVIFLPLVFIEKIDSQRKKLFALGVILSVMSVTLFYWRLWHSQPERILDATTKYGGSWVVLWGPQGVLTLLANNQHLFSQTFRSVFMALIFLAAYLVIIKRKFKLLVASGFLMLTFFIFTLSWAPQYVFWVWPFIVVNENLKVIKIFSLISLPYILVTYADLVWGLNFAALSTILSLPIWLLSLVLWYNLAAGKKVLFEK